MCSYCQIQQSSRLRWFPCLLQQLVVILRVETLCQCNCKCNCYVITVFIKYEHNMAEFILKSLTSQCHGHAPCCAGSNCSNRRCLLQSLSLANIPVFVLGREAWPKLYGKCSFIGFKKSQRLGMFSHDIMIYNGTFILAKPSSLRSGFSSVVYVTRNIYQNT